MSLFGRSKHHLECIAADFMPFEQQLHIIVADADMNLQVLQFDPDSTSIAALSPYMLTMHLQTQNLKLVHVCSINPLSIRDTSRLQRISSHPL